MSVTRHTGSAADTTSVGAEIEDERRARAVKGEPPFAPQPRDNRTATVLRDAVLAGVVAFALAGPIVGLRTDIATGGLVIQYQWAVVAMIVAVVVVGRILLNLFIWQAAEPVTGSFAKLGNSEPLTGRDWRVILAFTAIPAAIALFSYLVPEDWPLSTTLTLPVWPNELRLSAAFLHQEWVRLISVGLVGIVIGALLRKAMVLAWPRFPFALVLSIIGLLIALALPMIVQYLPAGFISSPRYIVDQAIVILTYIMLGWGLNIVVGFAGLLDLGYVAFFAVGAYSFALLSHYYDLSFWACLPLAGLLAATWGVILGFPVLRLRGDYLAIVTLAFGEIIRVVLINWVDFTGGPNGINNVPRPTLFGIPFERGEGGFAATFGLEFSSLQRIIFLYYVILAMAMITGLVITRLRRLPIGRAWEALREDEIACRSLGINTRNTKLTAFATGAMFAGFAGSFFATRQGFISPESFVAMESFIILAVVVLGGLGSMLGIVIAVIFMNTVFELRDLAEYRMLIVGIAMVSIMVWRPRGLINTRRPTVVLKSRKPVSGDLVAEGRA